MWGGKLTSAGQVAGQSLVVHEHLAGGGGVRDGVLGRHVSAHHPEAATGIETQKQCSVSSQCARASTACTSCHPGANHWLCFCKVLDPSLNSPEQSDAALGGGGHGAVIINGVLSGDVVLQEQALGVLLLQGVPLAGILCGWRGAQPVSLRLKAKLQALWGPSGGPIGAGSLTLLGSKSSLTLKLSTMQEAEKQRSTQASSTSSRTTLADSILRWRIKPVTIFL